jgi:hypothetical protein
MGIIEETINARCVTKEEFLALVEKHRITKKTIENVWLYDSCLTDLDLSGISMRDCFFYNCSFNNVHFKKNSFLNCVFDKIDMENVDFTHARLSYCKIRHLKMNNVKFLNGRLIQTLFNTVNFSNVDFTNDRFAHGNFGDNEFPLFQDCNFYDGNNFYGTKIKFPLSMSNWQDILIFCNCDYWYAGCFGGSTSQLIKELEAQKQGLQLIAYLSNMLMYANEPTMTDEMRSQIIEAHQRAVSKMQFSD